MKYVENLAFFAVLVGALATSVADAADSAGEIRHGVEFKLPTIDGEVTLEKGQSDFTVVCFLGTECPLARLYGPRLETLAKKHSDRVRVMGVNSNSQDSMEDLKRYADELKLTFPLAKDYKNVIADGFGAKRTPEVFVLDRELKVRYRGRIDDQYQPGLTRSQPTRKDLEVALDELLSGRPVAQPVTRPMGCLIGRTRSPITSSKVTYTKHVAGVLAKHCVECHRVGEIGPFALTDYDEVTGWADMIVEVMDEQRMPPWHANPKHGEFANARMMPEADKRIIREWVDAGAPFGDPDDLPEPVQYLDGWQLPSSPDLVVQMRAKPFTVPADGTVEYQYFVVDPGFEEDKWISIAQIIPGDRGVVHHAIAFVRPPDGESFRGIGWLTAYVPGQRLFDPIKGHARRIPAKSKLVFQMHYTPNGSVAHDNTKLGIVFADEQDVTHEVFTLLAIDQEFEIPPHSSGHKVSTNVRQLPKTGTLLAMAPHMHVRGQSFQVFAEMRDSRSTQTLLDVPKYDFNWQHSYLLRQPLNLADVKSIKVSAVFDNSADNPVNPDPTQHVTWGDQTWEEMAVAFFEVAQPRNTNSQLTQPNIESQAEKSARSRREIEADQKADATAKDFIRRFDTDGDGEVHRDELPRSLRNVGWRRLDADRDNNKRLTFAELRDAARRRYLRK